MDNKEHIAYISVGSNLGNKKKNCQKGIDCLVALDENRLLAQSPFYKTEPVDYKDQDWFINGVARIETQLLPSKFLKALKEIEKKAGRDLGQNAVRFGPRILDMDILLYDNLVIDEPMISIPHPRMHERVFVLKPLCDIDSQIIHPVSDKSAEALLAAIDDKNQGVELCS
ncbi:2-amino-4-hydroxy-6-hydroxymethyldihydropteridine diphosphokinase [Desulfobacterales bacterium HSG16]|nr:2-amino-4-hydroxy-6-hydroxymethyldihydropteridine diphosphokinase [Desulfobacterales bacterium HSG16]